MADEINWQNRQNSYPRCKQRGIAEFCPFGYRFCNLQPRSKLQGTYAKRFKYDVFISYGHKGEAWVVDTLLPALEKAGLKICIDCRDFEAEKMSLPGMLRKNGGAQGGGLAASLNRRITLGGQPTC